MIPLTQGKFTIVDDDDYERFGHLNWHLSHGRAVRRYGKWSRETKGYKGNVWLHREIMGNPEGLFVDHINGNPLDNRKANLRLCTQSQNMGNARKTTSRKTTSRFKGVAYQPAYKNKWGAYIGKSGDGRLWLGSYPTELDAALAYNKAAIDMYGEFARLNEVDSEQPELKACPTCFRPFD